MKKGSHMNEDGRRRRSEGVKLLWQNPTYRKHMSDAHKGKPGNFRGRPIPPDVRRKISAALIGRTIGKYSAERCRHISEGIPRGELHPNFGKHRSAETCRKMSESQRGRVFSEDHRRKMREAHVRRWARPESHVQMSESSLRKWQNPGYRQRLVDIHKRQWREDAELRERNIRAALAANHARPNRPESAMQGILDRNFPGEWKYCGDGTTIIDGKNPDFLNVNGRKAVIEVFGDYWHSEKIRGIPTKQHVAERVAHFAKSGFDCLVIWEHEVRDEKLVVTKVKGMV